VLKAYKVVQVRLIFTPVTVLPVGSSPPVYFYGKAFKFSPSHREEVDGVDIFAPAPVIDMFMLNRHLRANNARMGDIFCLKDVRDIVQLVPQFGVRMDDWLTSNNSLEIPDTFYLNNFADKENFHAILSYQ